MIALINDPEFWVGVGFVAVIAILVWKGAPAFITGMLDRRAAVIAAELAEARRLHDEAMALLHDYKAMAAGAETEAESLLTQARADAAAFAAESRANLAAQIARRAQAAQDKIAQAEAAAMHEIRALAADGAVKAAEKLIVARLDEARASRFIDESIANLGDKLN